MNAHKKQRAAELARIRRTKWNAHIAELREKAAKREEEKKKNWENKIRPLLEITRTDSFKMWYANYSRFPWDEGFLEDNLQASFFAESPAFKALVREFSLIEDARKFFRNEKIADKFEEFEEIILKAWQRRAKRIKDATPPWYDKWQVVILEERRRLYNDEYPEDAPWHIDHIVPLQGKNVCGLHVHTNMQLIPGSVNLRKNNKFDIH